MKSRKLMAAVVVAFVAGIAITGAAAFASDTGDQDASIPAAKASAEAAPEATDISGDSFSDGGSNQIAPISGTAVTPTTNDIKIAVPEIFTNWGAAGRLDPAFLNEPASQQLVDEFTPSALASRRALLAKVFATDVDSQLEITNSGLKQAIGNPASWLYTDNKFAVSTWQGIQWNEAGQRGRVVFLGHASYKNTAGVWSDDSDTQWDVSFIGRAGQGFFITAWKSAKGAGDEG